MIKLMFLMKRRQGMSRAEFREYYENRHAPFMLGVVGKPAEYRRNYTVDPAESEYDAITEIVYTDAADLAAAQAAMAHPDNADRIREDEARFVDPASVRAFVVDCVDAS